MKHIKSAKEAGELFSIIKKMLVGASKNNPVETDIGTFTSWRNFIETQGLCRETIDNYIKLAENWDIVLKLGMQDASNIDGLKNSMRVCRTLKIIKWVLQKKKSFRDSLPYDLTEEERNQALEDYEATLTVQQYWEEQEAELSATQAGPTKRQLQEQLEFTQTQLALALDKIDQLKAELQRERRLNLTTV
jgi:hypothetical protein